MPELPEVEVVKRSLRKVVSNLIIKKVIINSKKLRYKIDKKKFQRIINKKITSIKRRSKYLLINLDTDITILVHLGMTGKFFIRKNINEFYKTSFYYEMSRKHKKHDHVIFKFNKKTELIYNDVRKFGFIKIINTNEILNNVHLKLLGPEPLSEKFDLKYFNNYIHNKKKTIKDTLMDQKFVSGLGNIYVNEVLYLSKINPKKSVNKLNNKEINKIILFTKKTLKVSIQRGGSSIQNFSDSDGKSGTFQQNFNVYAREGMKCTKNKCKEIIKKTNISNRSTFFCKSCQK
jgi:formamidopyrimidine-DNA glycosylase|tara:strand:+ start:178 stop:1044 length:867 start_codon:yes stop_codon:yes gene_type:complete